MITRALAWFHSLPPGEVALIVILAVMTVIAAAGFYLAFRASCDHSRQKYDRR